MIRRVFLGLTIAFLVLSPLGAVADAAPLRLRLEDPTVADGLGFVISDNGAGDLNPMEGVLTFTGSLGGFVVNVTTGLSGPAIGGTNNYAEQDLNSVHVRFGGPGSLRITLEDSSYVGGPNGQALTLVGLVGGTLSAPSGSSASFQSWANSSNLIPALGADTASPTASMLGPLGAVPAGSSAVWPAGVTFGPGAFSSEASTTFVKNGPYSLFSQALLTFSGPGLVSFDLNTSVVPEPGTLMLFGSGLVGIVRMARRRRKTA